MKFICSFSRPSVRHCFPHSAQRTVAKLPSLRVRLVDDSIVGVGQRVLKVAATQAHVRVVAVGGEVDAEVAELETVTI